MSYAQQPLALNQNIPPNATVTSYPTLAAAQSQLQSCPLAMTDNVTYISQQVLQKHQQTTTKIWYTTATNQVPVAQATSVQIIQHPPQTICESAPAPVAAPCGPCGGATGFGGVGSGVPVGFNASKVGGYGGFSQSAFRY